MTAEALLSQNEELRRQLSLQQESVRTLTDSLARIERRGGSCFAGSIPICSCGWKRSGWRRRTRIGRNSSSGLLSAVSDLQVAQKEREQYRDQMLRLNEAMLRYLKTSQGGDAQARMDVEAQLRSTNELVAKSGDDAGSRSRV